MYQENTIRRQITKYLVCFKFLSQRHFHPPVIFFFFSNSYRLYDSVRWWPSVPFPSDGFHIDYYFSFFFFFSNFWPRVLFFYSKKTSNTNRTCSKCFSCKQNLIDFLQVLIALARQKVISVYAFWAYIALNNVYTISLRNNGPFRIYWRGPNALGNNQHKHYITLMRTYGM